MKALVTGGTGFIGSHVVDCLLANGHAVRLFSRGPQVPERLRGKDVAVFQGDLGDASSLTRAMDGADLFYHIGEIKNITSSASEKNVKLVGNITGRLAEKKIRRFVFVSSITVAGIPSSVPATEETEPQIILRDHYTAYKRRCEEIIRNSVKGCEYAIVRPAPVYGPGSRYLGRMIRAVGTLGPIGIPFVGKARNIAPLIHVKDLAEAVCRAGTEPAAAGQTFNLTDGLDHTWLDFFGGIAETLGRKLRIIPLPPLLLKLMGAPVDLFSGFFGFDLDPVRYIDFLLRDILFDNTRAKSLLHWEPRYSLAEGVREMVEYYRAE
jgi:nucleoside-diphosphate-sugar epimerase